VDVKAVALPATAQLHHEPTTEIHLHRSPSPGRQHTQCARRKVCEIAVHPAHAGRGVGRALLNAAHDALRAAGFTEAYLFVHEQNERALAVYVAAGYRPDGSDWVSEFRGTRIRELRLVKQLRT
jgi:GNAT superfamily N-acetyltransferase